MTPVHGKTLIIAAFLFAAFAPVRSFAHGGGPLDANGCHYDHRLHDYHCHSGKLRGKHFKSRADMLRMLKTGEDTSIASNHPGHFQDLVKSLGRKKPKPGAQAEVPAPPAGAGAQSAPVATTAVAPAAAPTAAPAAAAAVPGSLEDRLSVLKRLYEKDLITKREYDEKRQQILDTL